MAGTAKSAEVAAYTSCAAAGERCARHRAMRHPAATPSGRGRLRQAGLAVRHSGAIGGSPPIRVHRGPHDGTRSSTNVSQRRLRRPNVRVKSQPMAERGPARRHDDWAASRGRVQPWAVGLNDLLGRARVAKAAARCVAEGFPRGGASSRAETVLAGNAVVAWEARSVGRPEPGSRCRCSLAGVAMCVGDRCVASAAAPDDVDRARRCCKARHGGWCAGRGAARARGCGR